MVVSASENIEPDSRVTLKTEIKSHPGFAPDAIELEPAPPILPVIEESVEISAQLSPPPLEQIPDPPMEVPRCIRGDCPSAVTSEPANPILPHRQKAYRASPPTPPPCCDEQPVSMVEDSLGLDPGVVLGIFILGALTGSSILYAFSKPMIVYAASAN